MFNHPNQLCCSKNVENKKYYAVMAAGIISSEISSSAVHETLRKVQNGTLTDRGAIEELKKLVRPIPKPTLRRRTGYSLFAKEMIRQIRENPLDYKLSFNHKMKYIAECWARLDIKERDRYNRMAQEDDSFTSSLKAPPAEHPIPTAPPALPDELPIVPEHPILTETTEESFYANLTTGAPASDAPVVLADAPVVLADAPVVPL